MQGPRYQVSSILEVISMPHSNTTGSGVAAAGHCPYRRCMGPWLLFGHRIRGVWVTWWSPVVERLQQGRDVRRIHGQSAESY